MEAILGIIIGILLTISVVYYIRNSRTKKNIKTQSVILLDKIKTVCKFITVEGDFAEIYHYEDVQQKLLNLVSSRKKALLVINAKAYVGYDLTKVQLEADKNKKRIIVKHFPQPQILSVETHLDYYDKKEGIFNKFEAKDLTNLHQEARQHIVSKIPESGLLEAAKKEALQTIGLMENIVQTIGWKLDYTALELENEKQKLIR